MSKKGKIKKCKYCQSEIDNQSKVCPICNKPPKTHGCLIPILVFVLLLIGSLIAAVKTEKGGSKNKKEQNLNNSTIAAKYIDISDSQSKQIDKILQQCGIENIISFEHGPMLDEAHSDGETGYRISTDRATNIILCLKENKKVHNVAYAGHKLYAKKKVVAKIQDYTFSMEEIAKWQDFCQEQVINILKSPKSARFPNYTKWGFKKNKKEIIIQGYVDAQNSFGAELRSTFQFKINAKNESIESFVFDGKELMQ